MYQKILVGLPSYQNPDSYCMCSVMKSLIELQKVYQGFRIDIYHIEKTQIHIARSLITTKAYAQGYDYIIWIDDDQVLQSNTLVKMYDRRVQAVTALVYGREYPYPAIAWTKKVDGISYRYGGATNQGLHEVISTGLPCTMVNRDVIDVTYQKDFVGKEGFVGEDIAYWAIVKDAGIKIWLDTDIVVGHCINTRIIVDEKNVEVLRKLNQKRLIQR